MRRHPRLKSGAPRKYRPRGASRAFFVDPELDEKSPETQALIKKGLSYLTRPEVLIEGPAGTGKTFGLLMWAAMMAKKYAGIRILFTRETRASMNETVLEQWEDDVLGKNNPIVKNGPQRENRFYYLFPNGSRVNVIGMNNEKRIMSGKYDIIIYFELVDEEQEKKWDALLSRLRNQRIPYPRGHADKSGRLLPSAYKFDLRKKIPDSAKTIWDLRRMEWFARGGPLEGGVWPDGTPVFFHTAIGDCNPGHPMHWANKRPERKREKTGKPQMLRLKSRHEDNPTVTDEYIEILKGFAPEKRARLYEGKWMAAEGRIFKDYDSDTHDVATAAGMEFDWYIGGMDFGYEDAGVLQVWGVNATGLYRVFEVYRTHQLQKWWVELAADVCQKFPMRKIMADPSRPETIESINQKLAIEKVNCRVEPANNSIQDGLDAIIYGLNPGGGAAPLIHFVQDAFSLGFDTELEEKGWPVCTEQEMSAYVWDEWRPGKSFKEKPKDGQRDHGIDTARYVAAEVLGKDRLPEAIVGEQREQAWQIEYWKDLQRKLHKRNRRHYASPH